MAWPLMGHAPPVARLALAYAAGVAWALTGAPAWTAPLALGLYLFAPIGTSRRPIRRRLWLAIFLVGLATGLVAQRDDRCLGGAPDGARVLTGRFLAAPRDGSGPFEATSGCGPVTVVVGDASIPAGIVVTLRGRWQEGRVRPWFLAEDVRVDAEDGSVGPRWAMVRWREGLRARLDRLYGSRGPLVAALVLARREGLDPDVREAFARSGIAHLLAISGFHVGVVAGLALVLLRAARIRARRAALGSAVVVAAYVALIGFPDAALRAALILGLVSASRATGRPPARWGALSAALIVLVALDPRRLTSPGFQLSFAGAAGLVAWAPPLTRAILRRAGRWCPRSVATACAAGIAATVATLPIVAWHFERVSLIGIPVTLLAGPLVALALPGALATLAIDFVQPDVAAFLAGGVDLLLLGLERIALVGSAWRWASLWTPGGWLPAVTAGLTVGTLVGARPYVGASTRRAVTVIGIGVAGIAWPMAAAISARGSIEIMMIDVGQGDAIALRSPAGRWLLVDAGPPDEDRDPGAHPVVRALRRRGVRRIEAMFLTHPDVDHIGGATEVLATLEVAVVYDPGLPAGKAAFVEVLESARRLGVPWRAARAGRRLDIDGMVLEILSPTDSSAAASTDGNASSVVIRVSFGAFDVLLAGDAPASVERRLSERLASDIEVLKVGHHGSTTSTDSLLLARGGFQLGLVSVGRRNRYGHPAPSVIERLTRAGVAIHRTDREGTVSVVGRPDGRYVVDVERPRARRDGGGRVAR